MKNNIKSIRVMSVLLILLMVISSMAVLSSCGKKEEEKEQTLETYLQESESGMEELEKINESLSNESFEGKIDVKDNAITMTMTLQQPVSKDYYDTIKSTVDDMLDSSEDAFKSAVSDLEEESGIKGVTMKIYIYNADGTEIYNRDIV